MEKLKCQYCDKELSSKYNLKLHQEKAKYCLKIQGKNINGLKCEYCNALFTRKSVYDNHMITCKVKKSKTQEELVIELKEEIIKLKDDIIRKDKKIESIEAQLNIYKNLSADSQQCIKEIAKQPKNNNTTNNTTTNNILSLAPLDMNILKEQLSNVINTKMTEEHVLEGQEGIAKLVSCCFTTDDGKKLITCTDISRGVWKSKDVNGNIIKDYKANNIAKVIKPLATLKANKLIEIDDIKRKKIYELFSLRKRRKERIETDKFEVATQRGYKKNSIEYNMCEDRMRKRSMDQNEDDELEKEIIEEFKKSDELYLLDLPEDIDKPYKMYLGKKDIVEMADDSSKFSNKLITLV
jgi:hypothetical protein